MEKCLLVEVKPSKKILGAQICVKQAKIGSKISLFCHFFKFGSLVFLEMAQDDSLEHRVTPSRGKTHEKNLGGAQIGSEIRVFVIFSRLHH